MPCRGRGVLALLLVSTTAARPITQAGARQLSPEAQHHEQHHEDHHQVEPDAPDRDEKQHLVAPPALPPSPGVPPAGGLNREGTALSLSVACGVLLLAILVQQSLRGSVLAGMLTETGSAIIIGAVFNLAFWVATSLCSGRSNGQLSIALSPTLHDIIYFGLLPPIIFEAGFTMRKKRFFANFGAILLFAVLGTLISIVSTGGLVYLLAHYGLLATRFTLAQAMLFGSLISSTDPVATISILKRVHTQPLLSDLLFGESALNDALSIVLFNIFRKACKDDMEGASSPPPPPFDSFLGGSIHQLAPPHAPPPHPSHHHEPVWPMVTKLAHELAKILPCSLAMGLVAGLLSAWFTRRMAGKLEARAELSLLLVFCLGTYTLTDEAGLSGILALFVAGVTMHHYTYYNLSTVTQAAATTTFATLAALSEAALALILGIALVDYLVHLSLEWDAALVGAVMPVLLVARGLSIFPLSAVINCCRSEGRISCRMQSILWLSGLRGAISFALAMTLDDSRHSQQVMPLDAAKAIVTTTLFVIVLTNLVFGPLTKPLVWCLGLGLEGGEPRGRTSSLFSSERGSLHEPLSPASERRPNPAEGVAHGCDAAAPASAVAAAPSESEACPPSPKRSGIHRAWRIVDQEYFKPLFGGRAARGGDEQQVIRSEEPLSPAQ